MLSGVSTLKYRRVQEPLGEAVELDARSTSKSAVSRTFVQRTRDLLWKLITQPLANLPLAVMMLDAIELHGRTNIVALGSPPRGTSSHWSCGKARPRTRPSPARCSLTCRPPA